MVLTRIARGARRTSFILRSHLQHLRAVKFVRPLKLNSHRARPAIAAAISMYATFAPLGSSAIAAPLPSTTSAEDSLRPRLVVAQAVPRETTQSPSLAVIQVGESRETAEQARLAQLRAEEEARAAALKAEEERKAAAAAAEAARKAKAAQEAAEKARLAAIAQEQAAAAALVQQAAVTADASRQELIAMITKWSQVYGADPARMIRLAQCESGVNPKAKNRTSSASGLYQFMPKTFTANARAIGIANPNIWDPEQQAQTAAYMIGRIGQAYQWACKY